MLIFSKYFFVEHHHLFEKNTSIQITKIKHIKNTHSFLSIQKLESREDYFLSFENNQKKGQKYEEFELIQKFIFEKSGDEVKSRIQNINHMRKILKIIKNTTGISIKCKFLTKKCFEQNQLLKKRIQEMLKPSYYLSETN
jgi:hypothetical protein